MLSFDIQYHWQDFQADYQAQLPAGITSILGPSGGGKSTLLSLLGGYLSGQGRIEFLGKKLDHLAPYERPVSMLFQSDNLFPQLNVWDNIAIGMSPTRRLTNEQNSKLKWALEQTQLLGFAQKFPEQLSGGQAQRVAVARVLVRDKPVLLLDEPFSALDPRLRDEMLQLVRSLTHQFDWTTVMVTHAPNDAKTLGGQVMLVEHGQVQALVDVQALSAPESGSLFAQYLGL